MSALPIAAIVYTPDYNIEALMADIARHLGQAGVRVGGVIQHDDPAVDDSPCAMALEDLASGKRYPLSQDLGSGSEACCLDPAALAEAGTAIRRALEDGAELIMINKFGGLEAGGTGLRDEMGVAALSGTPLLTAVGQRFLADWHQFTGGEGRLLDPRLDAVLDWWASLPGT